ncbi:MAG: hypothetical protein WC438_01790 [Candidatus Pacearchaeota archaeon]
MNKQELIDYVKTYVQFKRFTPQSGSIPQARKKDLANLMVIVNQAEERKILDKITPEVANLICSSYYQYRHSHESHDFSDDSPMTYDEERRLEETERTPIYESLSE